MEPVTATPRQPKQRTWLGRHPRRTAAVVVLLLAAVAAALFITLKPQKEAVTSKNPVVAGYQKQLPALAEKAKDNPQDAQAAQDYGMALYATGDVEGARAQYEASIKADPKNATSHNNLGNVYRDLSQYEKAVVSYTKALELDPKAAVTYANLANLYMYTLNKKDLGIQTCQDGLKNLPGNPQLQVLLGVAYEQSGDREAARGAFRQALDTNPGNVEASMGLKRVQ